MTEYIKSLRIILLLLLVNSVHLAYAESSLTLGIHPYKSPQKLIKIYKPLADHIAKKINQPVRIIISKNYDTHIQLIGKDKLDIAYLGPASYVKMVDLFGKKEILARQAINHKPTFQGKIIVRKGSKISTIKQLRDKKFAFGDPNSTMSHLVPRYMLLNNSVTARTLKKLSFLGSHDNVALGVLTGDYDAGAVKEAVFHKYKSRGIKTLATTPALSEHLFVASNNLPKNTVAKIRQILLNLKNTPEGLKAMSSIKSKMTSMMPAEDKDYNNLRNILHTLEKNKIIK